MDHDEILELMRTGSVHVTMMRLEPENNPDTWHVSTKIADSVSARDLPGVHGGLDTIAIQTR